MKSETRIFLTACLFLFAGTASSRAAGDGGCEVAVAALTLPDEATGLLHWRSANEATQPLQLSTRYFSERIKVPGKVIHFHDRPLQADKPQQPPAQPLVAVNLPAATKLVFVILWAESGEGGATRWRSMLFRGEDWKAGSLKVLNGAVDTVGIAAGEKRLQVARGKALDFHANDFKEAFPVKIFRLKPEPKLLFSSKWRIAADRRELCFISGNGDAISLRSLLDLAAIPANPGQ
jgi:hypothetical protein